MIPLIRHLLLALALICAAPAIMAPALAQQAEQSEVPDYEAWERDANRAEEVLDAARASDEGLTALRAQLAEWRERFLAAQDINATRIATLREQLAALGPAPAEGESEADDIASRRAALNEEIQTALAPVRRAEEAYTRANGLITQLDAIVRERQAERIFRLDPTPLNPVLWDDALIAIGMVGEAATGEVANNYVSAGRRTTLRQELPLTLGLLAIGLVLVFRSSTWIERGVARLRANDRTEDARLRVATFLTSVLGVILPVVGILALLRAVEATQMTAVVGDTLLTILAMLVAFLAAARWLSNQVFPKAYPPAPILPLEGIDLTEGRFYALILAFLMVLRDAVNLLSDTSFLSQIMTIEVQSVLLFPVIAMAGLMLFRLGQLMRKAALAGPAEEDSSSATNARGHIFTKTLSRGAMLFGVAGPILAAIGFVNAGGMLVFSSVLTLALFALLAVLQRFVRNVYAMVIGTEASANSLIPVLVGFALVFASLPVLALIWGARYADISEGFAIVSAGFMLGDTRISPADFLTFAVIFTLGYLATRFAQSTLKTQVLPKTKLDLGGRNAVVSGVGYVGIFLAALLAITGAGIDLSSLAIVAGALSVGIGFGLQTIVSNFVSGIILLVERPISEGDWIEVGGTMGVVRDISVRATRVETFDRRDVIVPNADLISTSVTNWTKGNLTGRIIVAVGVAYGTDTRKVEAILREIAEAHPQVIVNPPPNVFFVGFGADSLDFEIRAILRDVNYVMQAPSEIRHEIVKRFAEAGIEIPFAQRDLWLRNPEALREALPGTPKAQT
ncbi:MAG: DUF3772 domain-containing protein [Pseudomonadota bacterium]